VPPSFQRTYAFQNEEWRTIPSSMSMGNSVALSWFAWNCTRVLRQL
jgi:hypothetical protein